MSDKPIAFSAPMIRALLSGSKSQTRRMLAPQPTQLHSEAWEWKGARWTGVPGAYFPTGGPSVIDLLRYAVGDRLWVREAWRADVDVDEIPPRYLGREDAIRYEADQAWKNRPPVNGRLRPAMFMCRWMSRFTLTVVARKAERLQAISEDEASVEGVEPILVPPDGGSAPHVEGFRALWELLHGLDAWDANPWVGAYTFSVEKRNIDAPVQGANLASVAR